MLACYLNLANPNEESLKKIRKRYLPNIRFASLLGAGVVGTETGAMNEAYQYEQRNHSEDALQVFIDNLRPIVEYAEKMGVVFAIEPVFKHIVYNPKRARQVLDEMASPNLQIIFDRSICCTSAIIRIGIILLGSAYNPRRRYRSGTYQGFCDGGREAGFRGGGTGDGYGDSIRFIKKEKPYIHVTLENTNLRNAETARRYIRGLWDGCQI